MKESKIIAIIAIFLFIGILGIVAICLKDLNTQVLEENSFYQYFVGRKVEYEGGIRFSRKNNITQITVDNDEIELDSTPLYYKEIENKVIFPEDMILVFPNKNGKMYKINHFSNVYLNEGILYLEGEEQKPLENCFLYDGQDLYFFTEKTKIVVGETEYELSPMSYVICDSQGFVEIYQKEEDNYITIQEQTDKVIAYAEDYQINLNTDSIKNSETEQLLIKNKDFLNNY